MLQKLKVEMYMDDFVVGYNRSAMKKDDISHGYALVHRFSYILDCSVTVLFVSLASIIALNFHNIDSNLKFIYFFVIFIAFTVYFIIRIKNVIFTQQMINTQFEVIPEIVSHYTFYTKMMHINSSSIDLTKTKTLKYVDIIEIIFDKTMIVVKNKENRRLVCINPMFLKNISIDKFIEYVKNENPKVKITRMID
ncbi:hypothetical protein KHQ89_01545 [Mycoplasmatota bacterium]|nr:hypothetical protein KHQ89_01545 [Mycoplasmatota bacterium]